MDNPYIKDVSEYKTIDIYRILRLYYVTNPAVAHAIKKLLCAGDRGHKGWRQDITEARDSINRAIEMMDEDNIQ